MPIMTFKSHHKIFNWTGQSKNSCIHFQIECIQLEISLLCLFFIFIIWTNHHTRRKGRIFTNNRYLEESCRIRYRKRAANLHFASNLDRRSSINWAFWRVILSPSSTYRPDPMNHNNRSTTAGSSLFTLAILTIVLKIT